MISSLSRRRRARQFSGFLGSPPRITSGSFCVLGVEFTPWAAPGLFCVLGSAFSLWVVPGAFCVLRSFIFLLGFLKVFRNFNVRVWSVSCVIGLGSLVRAFFFLVLPTPRAVLGPTRSLFSRLFAFLPSRRPPHAVRGHGLGNRAAKQRHGTEGLSCSFFCRPADALLSSEPGGSQRNLATHTAYVLSSFFCDARCFVFSFGMCFRLGTSPPRGTVGCATFPFRVGFRLLSRSPATMMVACGRVLNSVSLVFAPVFSFNSPSFVSLPPPRRRYAEGF